MSVQITPANSECSGESAHIHRLARAFAARIPDELMLVKARANRASRFDGNISMVVYIIDLTTDILCTGL